MDAAFDIFKLVNDKEIEKLEAYLNEHGDENSSGVNDQYGCSLLMYAAAKLQVKTVDLLLKRGHYVNHVNKVGNNAMLNALSRFNDVEEYEESKYLDKDALSIHITKDISDRLLKIVKKLIEAGIDINIKDRYGNASFFNHEQQLELLEILLEYGIEKEITNMEGATPLISAAFHGRVKCVELLLKYGADPSAKDGHDHDFLYYLGPAEKMEIEKFMEDMHVSRPGIKRARRC